MFSHRSMMDDRRRGTPAAFANRLAREVEAGTRALDGENQSHIEVLTGKRLQQLPPGEGPEGGGTPLVLTSLEPNTVAIGQPSFDIHVMGTGFDVDTVIIFNGFEEPTTLVSPTEVTTGVNMDVWTAPSLPLPVHVEDSAGNASNALMFTFTAAPEAGRGAAKSPTPPTPSAKK